MIDIHTLAKELDLSESWIYLQVAQRKIPFVRLGRAIRFDMKEIHQWLEAKRIKAIES
jgi:excisionase family DNA binding protein